VIGGVITSTVLTLLVIPTIYEILSDWRDGLAAWISRRRGQEPAVRHGAPAAPPRPAADNA
jgi:HAE1 family hydrophobic/amphiphilic exporter-1